MLQYKTLTPLNQGDRILYSYGPSYSQPRRRRQEPLLQTRDFTCQCKRCISFDECNPYKCPHCEQQTMFEGWRDSSHQYQLGIYYCLSCDNHSPEIDLRAQTEKFAHFEDELDRIVMLLRRGQLLPACRKSIQTIADINSYSPSSLHWIYPAAWKHIRDAFSSAARNSMQRGQSSSHPEVSSSLLYSGCSQLLDAMWTQQIYCIISGHTSLENASIAHALQHIFFLFRPTSIVR